MQKNLLKNNSAKPWFKGGDVASINGAVAMCLKEYRQRSSFKPDVMTYLLDKAKRFVKTSSTKGK